MKKDNLEVNRKLDINKNNKGVFGMKHRIIINSFLAVFMLAIGLISSLFSLVTVGFVSIFILEFIAVWALVSLIGVNLVLNFIDIDAATFAFELVIIVSLIAFGINFGIHIATPLGSIIADLDTDYYKYTIDQRLEKKHEKFMQEEVERWEALVDSHPSVVDWNIVWNEDLNTFETKGEQPAIVTMNQNISVSDINLTNTSDKPVVLKNINFAWNGEDYVAGEINVDEHDRPYVIGEWVFVEKAEFDSFEDIKNYRANTRILSIWVNGSDSFIHEEGTSNVKLEQDLDLVIEPNESITIEVDAATTYYFVPTKPNEEGREIYREMQFVIEEV